MLSFLSHLRDAFFSKSRDKEIEQKVDLLTTKLTDLVESRLSALELKLHATESKLSNGSEKKYSAIESKLASIETKLTTAVAPIQSTLDTRIRGIEALLAHVFAVRQDTLERSLLSLDARLATLPAETKSILDARFQLLESKLATEIDRLDLFLNYHAETLSERLTPRIFTAPDGRFLIVDDYIFVIPRDQLGLVTFLISHRHAEIESGVQRIIRERTSKGDMVVDIGANHGLHTVVMASAVGEKGKVVSFEPLHQMAASLEETVALNGFSSRVVVVAKAVAQSSGQQLFHESRHSPMSSLYALSPDVEVGNTPVATVSLDEYFAPGTKITLVKIDAEGAESLVYAGMSRIVAENPNLALILEWSATHFPRAGTNARDFYQRLRQDGFVLHLISDENTDLQELKDFDQVEKLDGANLLLTRSREHDAAI